jgi:hypothetical protein
MLARKVHRQRVAAEAGPGMRHVKATQEARTFELTTFRLSLADWKELRALLHWGATGACANLSATL